MPFLVIAPATLHTSPFCFPFVLYFLWYKLSLLLLTSSLFSFELCLLLQPMLLSLTHASVILFLVLEVIDDEVCEKAFFLPL